MRSRANIKFPEIYEDNNEFGIENGYCSWRKSTEKLPLEKRGMGGKGRGRRPGRIQIAPSGSRKDTSIEF